MDKVQKVKSQKNIRRVNVLESLKDMGDGAGKALKDDLLSKSSEEFFRQLFGKREEKKYSGEMTPGESLDLEEIYSGRREENLKLRQQISLERNLAREEKTLVERQMGNLRLQLQALIQEVYQLAQATQNIGEQVEVASMQAPANPGVYHLVFFEKLLEFIQSFRKKIEDASVWLESTNKRAEKKNFWATFKKSGTKFFLSPEHYLQRSAG